ncbi:MAG TPA: ABC transporter substrate-binding protein [Actinomycetes bacterium]|nr:ABC transporter substrate-binding protein [Actinomycetes bacterium]
MIRANATWRLVAVAGAAGLVLAACGSDDDSSGDEGSEPAATGTPLYLVDGNVGSGPLGELEPGTLEGTKGTLPGAQISDDLKERLNQVDPKLVRIGYSYAPESYDAVMLVALSAQQAQSDAGRDMAAEMQDISAGGTKCTTFAECNDLISQGEDIDYDGASGPVEFDDFGDPTSASIGIYQYDAKNTVPGYNADGEALAYQSGEIAPTEGNPPALTDKKNDGADGQLQIGGYLPLTGSLASLGPPEVAAVELAIDEVNDEGGVLGKPIQWFPGDSSDSSNFDKGTQTIQGHISKGVDAIVGAASSSVSLNTLKLVTDAGILQISPANTSPDLTTFKDGGLFFRTAPSDVLQGRILADLLLADGVQNLAIISLQDAYGEGLAKYTTLPFEEGGGTVVTEPDTEEKAIFYDPTAQSFSAEVTEIAGLDPDAIVLIGFDESAKVVEELVKQGIGPNS